MQMDDCISIGDYGYFVVFFSEVFELWLDMVGEDSCARQLHKTSKEGEECNNC